MTDLYADTDFDVDFDDTGGLRTVDGDAERRQRLVLAAATVETPRGEAVTGERLESYRADVEDALIELPFVDAVTVTIDTFDSTTETIELTATLPSGAYDLSL